MCKKIGIISLALLISVTAAAQTLTEHFQRANTLVQEKKLDQAIDEYEAVLKLHPKNGLVHLQLGLIYANQDNAQKAIEHLRRALAITPGSARAHYYLGLVYAQNRDFKKAVVYYKKASELDPKAFLTFYNLGIVYIEQRNYNGAVEAYKKALALNPRYTKTYVALAGALQSLGRRREALKQVKKLRSMGENDLANALANRLAREYKKR